MSRVPIIGYHHIGAPPPGTPFALLYVAEAQLDRQLWVLRRLGLRGVSMSEGLRALRHSRGRNGLVVLTFDDGYRNAVTAALPLLRHYGFSATCYVVSGRIGGHNTWDDEAAFGSQLGGARPPLLDRDDIGAWLAAGMELGSHSCTHPRLHECDEATAFSEIADSRAALGRLFGVAIDHFAYPFGGFNAATIDLVRRCGYASAVTTQVGTARSADSLFRLPRLLVDGQRGLARFLLQVGTPYDDLRQGRGLFVR